LNEETVVKIARVCVLVAVVGAVLPLASSGAAMNSDRYALKFFLKEPPADLRSIPLPDDARDIVVAWVRLVRPIAWVGGRDQSGRAPPTPKALFQAEIEVTETLRGGAKPGTKALVRFGSLRQRSRYMYAWESHVTQRRYVIVSYLDAERDRRLVGFSASKQEFERWQERFFEEERKRGRPGSRDH
jgi:hypothetical protein